MTSYHIGEELARGGSGVVYLASDNGNRSFDYVIKVYKSEEIGEKEAILMNYIGKHPVRNIPKMIAYNKNKRYIIMPKVKGVETFQYVLDNQIVDESLAYNWFKCLLDSVHDLHRINIIHGDIKAENVVIDNENTVQLIDFGCSFILNENQKVLKADNLFGTIYYMSPEILKNYEYSFQSDIWSMGVTLYLWTTGRYPFDNERMILQGKYYGLDDAKLSSELKDLIKLMLSFNKTERITISQIYNHPWVIRNLNKLNGKLVVEEERNLIEIIPQSDAIEEIDKHLINKDFETPHKRSRISESKDVNELHYNLI